MKRFKFSLEKVLSYKAHMLHAEKAALKRLCDRRDELTGQERAIKDRERFYRTEYENRCRAGIAAGQMALLRAGLDEFHLQLEQQRRAIRSMEGEIQRQVEKVVHMSGEKTSMDKLKEKQLDRYRYLEGRETEKFIEDFVQNKRFCDLAV